MMNFLKNSIAIIAASFFYAVAIKYFIMPSQVILTGFEGVALSISYFLEDARIFIILYLIFQFILLLFAFFVISRSFALRTGALVLIVVSTLPFLPAMTFASPGSQDERIILVIFGGLIAGAAKALAFKNRGSTGDEDIIATYLSHKNLKPVGDIAIYAGVASTIFGLILSYFKTPEFESVINTLMYTSIYIFVSGTTLNVLFKKYQLTKVIVTSQNPDLVSRAISACSDKYTYTMHEGVGGYSKTNQKILSTIIPHEELEELLGAIKSTDETAFIYYHDIEGVVS